MYLQNLTNQAVRDFINDTSSMTAGLNNQPKQKVLQYLDDHIDANAQFTISMTLHINEMPPNTQSMNYDKEQYISTVAQSLEELEGYNGDIEIVSLNIASNKQQAVVHTRMNENAVIPLPQPDGTIKSVPVQGQSECEQGLTLNRGVIQVFRANCETVYKVSTD